MLTLVSLSYGLAVTYIFGIDCGWMRLLLSIILLFGAALWACAYYLQDVSEVLGSIFISELARTLYTVQEFQTLPSQFLIGLKASF